MENKRPSVYEECRQKGISRRYHHGRPYGIGGFGSGTGSKCLGDETPPSDHLATPTGMYLMKNLFFDDVYIMILAFIIFGAVWLAMNIVFLTLVVVGKLKYEASVMARTHMIVKLVQIPAGLFAIACFSCMKNEGMITDGIQLVMSVFSFVFCADTIISVIAYINTKKHKAEALNN